MQLNNEFKTVRFDLYKIVSNDTMNSVSVIIDYRLISISKCELCETPIGGARPIAIATNGFQRMAFCRSCSEPLIQEEIETRKMNNFMLN